MSSTTTSDRDCNRVAYWPAFPDFTQRCTQAEGHVTACWSTTPPATMTHKHRRPVPTDTDPFNIRPRGGKHRAYVGAASGPNRVDSELRRRFAQVQS